MPPAKSSRSAQHFYHRGHTMPTYRHDLPQLKGGIFLTDGGMETTLVFHRGLDLPHFAAFPLLETAEGAMS